MPAPVHDNTVLPMWEDFCHEASVAPFRRSVSVLILYLDGVADVQWRQFCWVFQGCLLLDEMTFCEGLLSFFSDFLPLLP
jgi:hypothetical protein